eukprot:INCI16055.4.p1 GENE.INCI16055.4~~INCI16055.4.p1  ORF type:complete len:823 (-),score=120.06 INCI16055.4:196-2664(-)
MLLRLVFAASALLFVVDVASSTGTVLAKSNLETCTSSSSSSGLASSDCALKLVVTYAVPTGQNATDALELVISSVEDSSSGQQLFADKQVTLVINKTPIYFYYPTTYVKTVNYQPFEQLSYGSTNFFGSYTAFNDNPFYGDINSCDDTDESDTPTCGWAYDGDRNKIPASQGRCCKCSFWNDLGIDNAYNTRGNVQCNLESAYSQSSHCLRFDPLDYHVYSLGVPETYYAVQIVTNVCPVSNAAGSPSSSPTTVPQPSESCQSSAVTLSADVLSAKSADGLVYATLLGSLEAFSPAPTFESKYLAVPAGTNPSSDCSGSVDADATGVDQVARCSSRIQAGSDYWMFLDRSYFGETCNKIGVSYESFRFQSDFCEQAYGSCTRDQLADFWDYDQQERDAGRTGVYWAKNQGTLGLDDLQMADASGASLLQGNLGTDGSRSSSLLFMSDRYQQTLVVLELAADDVSFLINVEDGTIDSVAIEDFEENSNDGVLLVTVTSLGTDATENAGYTVSVGQCDDGIVVGGAHVLSLAGGASATVQFVVEANYEIGTVTSRDHACTVTLYNSRAEAVDTSVAEFSTNATVVIDDQVSCADTNSCGTNTGGGLVVEDGACPCSIIDLGCVIGQFSNCGEEFWIWCIVVGVVIGLLILFCCLAKCFGCKNACTWCCCFPCAAIFYAVKKSKQKNGQKNRRKTSHKQESPAASPRKSLTSHAHLQGSGTSPQAHSSATGDASINGHHAIEMQLVHQSDDVKHKARLCEAFYANGPVYFNVSRGLDSGFPNVLRSPGPQFSLRGAIKRIEQSGTFKNCREVGSWTSNLSFLTSE